MKTKPRPRNWYARRAEQIATLRPCSSSTARPRCIEPAIAGGLYCSKHTCTYGGCKHPASPGKNRCCFHPIPDEDTSYEERRYGK